MVKKLTEIFKAKNIGEDVIQSILADMKTNGIHLSGEENIDIRYGKLKTQHDTVTKERDEARTSLEQLQQAQQGQEALAQENAALKEQLQKVQTKAKAVQGLLEEKVNDVDYAIFLLEKEGKLEQDEKGEIKGWAEKMNTLKAQKPTLFDQVGKKQILENPLPKHENGDLTITRDQYLKMDYNDRLKLKQENPELYKKLSKGN